MRDQYREVLDVRKRGEESLRQCRRSSKILTLRVDESLRVANRVTNHPGRRILPLRTKSVHPSLVGPRHLNNVIACRRRHGRNDQLSLGGIERLPCRMIVPLLREESYELEGRRPSHAAMHVMNRLSVPRWRTVLTDLRQEAASRLGRRNCYPVFLEVDPPAERHQSGVGEHTNGLLVLRAGGAGNRA